jgi:hypothetical protein
MFVYRRMLCVVVQRQDERLTGRQQQQQRVYVAGSALHVEQTSECVASSASMQLVALCAGGGSETLALCALRGKFAGYEWTI